MMRIKIVLNSVDCVLLGNKIKVGSSISKGKQQTPVSTKKQACRSLLFIGKYSNRHIHEG